MRNSLLFRLVVLAVAMMCALGVNAQEAYAWYSPGTNSLTFCYDNERSVCVGTTYDLNDGVTEPGWITDGNSAYVKHVAFHHSFADVRPTSTYHWFYEMSNLESITGMNYLNTSEVAHMDAMFNRCYKLTSLDLSGFNTSNVMDLSEMFRGSSALRTIYVGDGWRLSDMAQTFSRDVFNGCTSLVGGKGTAYDASHVDAGYAHIDGGPSNPGYFTEKTDFIRGDVDGDGSVDITDVSTLIDLLLGDGIVSNPSADCNQDGVVDIADVSSLTDYLLSGAW